MYIVEGLILAPQSLSHEPPRVQHAQRVEARGWHMPEQTQENNSLLFLLPNASFWLKNMEK